MRLVAAAAAVFPSLPPPPGAFSRILVENVDKRKRAEEQQKSYTVK